MNQPAIRAALMKRLMTLSPAVTTFRDNQTVPDGTTDPHLQANLIPSAPGMSGFDRNARAFERGIFQVTARYPAGVGAGAAEATAERIRTLFERGTILTEDGIQVRIPMPPGIGPAIVEPNWYGVPVSIRYTAFT